MSEGCLCQVCEKTLETEKKTMNLLAATKSLRAFIEMPTIEMPTIEMPTIPIISTPVPTVVSAPVVAVPVAAVVSASVTDEKTVNNNKEDLFLHNAWSKYFQLSKDYTKGDGELLDLIAATTTPGLVVVKQLSTISTVLRDLIAFTQSPLGEYWGITYKVRTVPTKDGLKKLHGTFLEKQGKLLASFLTAIQKSVTPGIALVPHADVKSLVSGRDSDNGNLANTVLIDCGVAVTAMSIRGRDAYVMTWEFPK